MGQRAAPQVGDHTNNAEICTLAIVHDLEETIAGCPARALMIGNSALAAVEIIFERYGISSEVFSPMFKMFWQDIVDSRVGSP